MHSCRRWSRSGHHRGRGGLKGGILVPLPMSGLGYHNSFLPYFLHLWLCMYQIRATCGVEVILDVGWASCASGSTRRRCPERPADTITNVNTQWCVNVCVCVCAASGWSAQWAPWSSWCWRSGCYQPTTPQFLIHSLNQFVDIIAALHTQADGDEDFCDWRAVIHTTWGQHWFTLLLPLSVFMLHAGFYFKCRRWTRIGVLLVSTVGNMIAWATKQVEWHWHHTCRVMRSIKSN